MQTRLNANALWATLAMILLWTAGPTAAPEAPVADAAMAGDMAAVETLLRGGADVNTAQGDGMTALHWAAHHGSVPMTKVLVYAGGNREAVTRLGAFTPLLVAAREGHGDVVQALLAAGANARARSSTGETALHFAAAAGSATGVEALLAAGAEVDARQGSAEQTPLMFAAHADRGDVVRLLLARGADVAARTRVVDWAATAEADDKLEKQRMELLKFMSGAEKGGTEYQEEETAKKPEEGKKAEEAKKPEEAKEPEEAASKAEEDERKPLSYTELVGKQGGFTALHFAARQGSAAAARALLEAGADIDTRTGGDDSTPLLVAIINGRFDLASELLEAGADPTLASVAGATPLYAVINLEWAPKSWYPQPTNHKEARVTYLELMESLLEAGADPNARLERDLWYVSYNGAGAGVGDTWGATPFWRAAWGTDVDAMKLLVAYGADPSIPTRRPPVRRRYPPRDSDEAADKSGLDPVPVGGPGVYPIHAATGIGYGEGFAANTHRHMTDGWLPATKYLVEELGADVNARDFNGYTALHHAASRGDTELILYLVSKGADVTAVSRRGQSTADMANGPVQRVQPFPEALALLESLGAVNNHNCVSC